MEQSDVKDVKENKPDFNLKLVFLVEIIDFEIIRNYSLREKIPVLQFHLFLQHYGSIKSHKLFKLEVLWYFCPLHYVFLCWLLVFTVAEGTK